MDHLGKFTDQVRNRLIGILLIDNVLMVADWWVAEHILQLNGWQLFLSLMGVSILSLTVLPWLSASYLIQPTRLIWQAILHIAPDTANTPAPDLRQVRLGRELVTSLVGHIYQLASNAEEVEKIAHAQTLDLRTDFVATNLPLPLLVLDKSENIVFANDMLLHYIQRDASEVIGANIYTTLNLSFTNDKTFTRWLRHAEAYQVTSTQSWERVRLSLNDNARTTRLFDMAAYYNKNNASHHETMVVFFDHTDQYSQDDQAMGYVALAVHELRTPITLLRGYIEVFEEELDGKVDAEMQGFIRKMNASSQQLSTFVNNILNVARVEDDQLELRLRKEDWPEVLQATIKDIALRAEVRGITLTVQVEGKLPPVAVDRVSIYEVINNLVDNAIKYSGNGKEIIIKSALTADNTVETTVQDFGQGIPESSMPHIFDKFYRDHHNRAQIGGTGLGLYLCKSIIRAHNGHIWVRSKPSEGSTFGFTLQPYDQLADDQKTGDNTGIVRSAHGWIKNHSLYRR